ncbi:MAG: hypothetical protein P4L57_13770 [Rhizomicrobium sp.]|nr:hypothetical protein [Rhizomicrobium sp.]
MRKAIWLMIGVCGSAAAALACTDEVRLPVGDTIAIQDSGGGSIPHAARGQYLGLACANVEKDGAVAVVLYPDNNQSPTGIGEVLAIEQKIDAGLVHVRVPDFPELADHTLHVKVFYRNADGSHVCDGGNVKIS